MLTKQRNYKSDYEISSLLVLGNIVVCTLAVLFFITNGGNDYVNGFTLALLCILALENILFLTVKKTKRDPFFIIISLTLLAFYELRVASLLYEPWSSVMMRYLSGHREVNYALFFIIFSNLAICFGLIVGSKGKSQKHIILEEKSIAVNPRPSLILLSAAIVCNYYSHAVGGIIGRLAVYINTYVLPVSVILLLSLVYFIENYVKIGRIFVYFFGLCIAVVVGASFIAGSRSPLMMLFFISFFALIATKNAIGINKKMVFLLVLCIIGSFFIWIGATYLRTFSSSGGVFSKRQLFLVSESRYSLEERDFKSNIVPLLDRMGFLDCTADAMAAEKYYRSVINPVYYVKSIIDNTLTPNFDVFGVPRASMATTGIYDSGYATDHDALLTSYQSNMFTLYGELYVLSYGYFVFALVLFFILSFMISRYYSKISHGKSGKESNKKAIILYLFFILFNSFGCDWFASTLLSTLIGATIFNSVVYRKTKSLGFQPLPVQQIH